MWNIITSAKLARGNDEIPIKSEVSDVAKLKVMFEKARPDVEEPRLNTLLGNAIVDKNTFLVTNKVNALVARFSIVQLNQVIPTLKTSAS